MKPFPARFRGSCGACDEPIDPGDLVRYDDDSDLVHDRCEPSNADDQGDLTKVCPGCWLVHSGECS